MKYAIEESHLKMKTRHKDFHSQHGQDCDRTTN